MHFLTASGDTRNRHLNTPWPALLGIFLAIAGLLFANAGHSEEDELAALLSLDLEELANYSVVTPTKTGTRLKDAPGSVSLISYEQIRNSSATSIPELLRLVPGVNVRWNPMVQTIEIRGFGSNPFTSKVLLLIDGIPYNSWNKGGFPQHPGFDFFNIDNIKHLEIVRGPGSALYGENALNGVINIITLSGEEFQQTSLRAYAGSRDTRMFSATHGTKLTADASLFGSVKWHQSQIPTDLWTDNGGSDAKGYDLFLKAKYQDLQFSYYRRDDRFDGYSVPLGSPRLPPGAFTASADEISQEVNIAALAYEHEADSGDWSFQANTSYADRDGSHCAGCHDRNGESTNHGGDFAGTDEDHGYQWFSSAQLGIHTIDNHNLLFGAEWRKISAGDHADEFETHGHGDSHGEEAVLEYDKFAAFLQDEISLLDGKLDLVIGARYEGETSPGLFGDEFFPRIAMVARPNDQLTLRASWSEAARYPSFTELYQNSGFVIAESPNPDDYIPLSVFAPNQDLQPEHLQSLEFGASYQFSSKLHANIDFYANEIDDSIVVVYPGPATPEDASSIRFENHASTANIRGAELEIRATPFEKLTGFINWSYQDSSASGNSTDSGGTPLELTYAPEHKINLSARYDATHNLSTTLEVSWRDEYDAPRFWYPIAFRDDPTPRPLDDYALVNLSLVYRLPMMLQNGKRPITVKLEGKNLTDETPYETLTGFGGRRSGREFFIGLEYDWTD